MNIYVAGNLVLDLTPSHLPCDDRALQWTDVSQCHTVCFKVFLHVKNNITIIIIYCDSC